MATEPAEIAATLKALVDVLLPGDERFPAASDAGTHGVVADRLVAQIGEAALDDLAQTIEACGGPLGPLGVTERQDVVRRFEAAHPEQFETLRMIAYLAYYESPAVVRAVRSLGHVYNDAPQPAGYVMAPFDESDPRQVPQHRRGGYVRTEDVTRLDLTPLPSEPLAPETITRDDAVASGRGAIARGAGGKPAGRANAAPADGRT
ncbi:MAG: hypothetical protein OXC15_10930 [Rhodospirillaceae bacterium]|nr:hypothetical protein [Rhodospirillaceae bacterium]